jgi:toxin-antitoxin system PIN domain toxin
MLVDANLLIYAIDRQADQHEAATNWLAEQLNGPRRVGLSWQTITAFLRIVSHPRAYPQPLAPDTAWQQVTDWLATPVAWIPEPGPEYSRILGDLITGYDIRGNLIPDATLAALAIEHGLTLYSYDTDFARFRELRWENPL